MQNEALIMQHCKSVKDNERRRQKKRLRQKTFAKWLKTKTKKKDKSRIKSASSYAGRTKNVS